MCVCVCAVDFGCLPSSVGAYYTHLTAVFLPRARGLRAIKSVLVVAGSLLRAEEGQVESQVLFRALRDFNIPKILAQVC